MAQSRALLNGLDLTTLRLLVAAAEEGNLARAAERENISLSAVSRRISEFELRYGVQVLRRHDRGVSPTADGAALLARISGALGLLENIARDLDELRNGARGQVRICAHMTALTADLPARLAEYLQTHPDVDIRLEEGTSCDAAHAVRVGLCDIAFVSGTIDTDQLNARPWRDDQLMATAPLNHPLARQSSVSFADLLPYPFVSMQKDSSLLSLFRTQARAADRELNERVHAASFESACAMVRAGLGVSILPATALAREDGIVSLPLNDAWAHRPLMLCTREGETLSSAARALIEYLAPRPRAAAAQR